jgi:hypothetical protein
MKWLAGAAVLLAIGAGLGTYLALDGREPPNASDKQAKRFMHAHTPDARIMNIPKAGP